MSHRVVPSVTDRLRDLIPFGLGRTKPRHFRDMLRVAWDNRDNAGHAWRVLTEGVCDGCALGVAGLHDWTIPGVHLCMTRLNLLRLNTMPEFDHGRLADLEELVRDLAEHGPSTGSREPRPDPAVRGLAGRVDNRSLREMGRLAYPMLREGGAPGFRRITWDEALCRMADRIRATTPERLAFFVTARGVTNEVYYMAQKVARFLGTNSVDNAARLCHAPSTGAMKHALGVSASTCSYRDWYGTDLVVFWGANPANDQPVTTKYLHEARALGTRVAIVNPYLEPGMRRYWVPSSARSALLGTGIADWWFPVSQGGDIAFIHGVLKILASEGWLNTAFIREHTRGWEELRAHLDSTGFPELEAASGLSRASMREFAELLHRSPRAVFVWSMGITQHAYGGDAVSAVLNLGLAMGYVGREKTGLMPIRGHSSVQGGAEMGCYATALPGGVPLTPENRQRFATEYGFPIPEQPGLNAVEMVTAAGRGDLDLLYCLGGNFLRTLPDPDGVAAALERVPFRVHQDIILTDQMLLPAAEAVLLLPAQTRYEQEGGGIETTTERRIAFSPEIPRRVGEARAEWRILRDLAAVTRPHQAHLLGCDTGPAIRREIARVVPSYAGCETLSRTGDALQYGGPRLCDDGRFPTHDGHAHFRPVPIPDEGLHRPVDPDGRPRFLVSTRRGKQFNTLVYSEVDPLTGAPRDAVFMNPDDAAEMGLVRGDPVILTQGPGRFSGRVFPAPLPPGNLQVHWPEGNVLLLAGVVDPSSGVPEYNAWVRVESGFPTE